jgi:hypothetical protein
VAEEQYSAFSTQHSEIGFCALDSALHFFFIPKRN